MNMVRNLKINEESYGRIFLILSPSCVGLLSPLTVSDSQLRTKFCLSCPVISQTPSSVAYLHNPSAEATTKSSPKVALCAQYRHTLNAQQNLDHLIENFFQYFVKVNMSQSIQKSKLFRLQVYLNYSATAHVVI